MSPKVVAFFTSFFITIAILLIGMVMYFQQNKLLTAVTTVSEAQAHTEHVFAEHDARIQHLLASIDENYRKLLDAPPDATFSQAKQIKAYEAEYLKKSDELRQLLASVNEASRRQTAILSRAVGENVPIIIPNDLSEELATMEQHVAQRESWPHNEAEAHELHKELSTLVQKMPTWAEEEALPRLTALRWSVALFDLANSTQSSIDDLEDRIPEYERLIESIPENVANPLRDFATDQLATSRKALAELKRAVAVKSANDALTSGSQLSAAISQLQDYSDSEASDLKTKLSAMAQDRQIADRFEVLEKSFTDSKNISDPQLRQTAVMRVAEGSLELLLEAQAKGNSRTISIEALSKNCNQELAACSQLLARQQEAAFATKLRAYQRWALDQIDAFETAFTYAQDSAHRHAMFTQTWNDDDYKAVSSAMQNDLLPISEGSLERPIAEMYQREFKKEWDKLEGRQDQTDLAKQCAIVVKKSPTEMEEK